MKVHAVEDRLHDFTADIFEIDAHLWEWRQRAAPPVGMLVVDGGAEAEIVFDPITFFIGAGGADKVAAVDFAELADYASSGVGSRGDDEVFARSRFADIEEPEISSESVVAQSAEKNGGRRRKGQKEFCGRRGSLCY